ncbi:TATA element modulatory factor 1 TATA binding-domain-containing protein [Pseudomassariella vexata]|uniref:TATA element modulatory factor 1 TATA binding-domain-containing protein n=1 Tax=Pseudomassariella vexata TaxID=1141098 RepID=A0A1Y2DBP1_9PEZI|nr:TATA element modulatory factor 1 TATA binding-domain-containing protein [Pseudomassariella vexata]ORY56678.1 TATA element modulatory factor 1 TATA binding-domain-containing protein [Pseudomassariella vexata]
MSAPKGSRWGSFLSQAVAGVEARLDNILSEEEQAKQQAPSRPLSAASSRPASTIGKSTNDRLQERLARAVAAKNAATSNQPRTSNEQSPRPSTDNASVVSSVQLASQSPRSSLAKDEAPAQELGTATEKEPYQPPSMALPTNGDSIAGDSPRASTQEEPAESVELASVPEAPVPTPTPKEEVVPVSLATSEKIGLSFDLYEKRIQELEKTLEDTQLQHQEELHSQVEQVDALQAKLQYLAREATEAARKNASAASAGSLEKKVAEKDQQVAQLMEEGQKLAGNEQKLRAVIKKLRTQIAADEKELNEQKIWRQKAEAEIINLRDMSRIVDESRKANDDCHKQISQLKRELDLASSGASSKDSTISDLKMQLQEESERAKALTAKVNDQVREAGQQRVKDLEDQVAALELEKNLVADRARLQAAELREKAERAAERSRAVELEMKGEVQILESKLEAVRARAEEASSGAVGDAQAKLLRQIETLQTQYSIASENWQGMEASLAARAASLEKERDEALRRESEMRRKARETAARAKRQEEELEEAKSSLPNVQRDLSDHRSQLEKLQKRAEEAEAALVEAKADFDKQRQAWKEENADKTSQERRPWLEEVALRSNSRPASPLMSAPQRGFSSDYLGLQGFPMKLRKTSAPSSNGDHSPIDRPASLMRRPSQQPPQSRPSLFSNSSVLTGTTTPSMFGAEMVGSPRQHPVERDDSLFDGAETSASPHNVLQDMVSVSTIAAGPSVQLVERMSAAIRRLESEKVAAKEELARISGQRDEARAEIVALMKEVEAGKTSAKKVEDLEKEVAVINERYQTTLEMLGEKSELVEELRADVDDVKAMYRDLVERTIK